MAMHTGIGVSKILVLAGAGYTTTILLKNNKLSDLLGELQSLVKGLEKSGDQSQGDSDYADTVAAQVRRLAAEVRQLASSRQNGQITVLNGGSGYGNLSSLILPAAAVGGLGYGYMWLKGISFSDLMYVTKQNMANAVTNLTKHLENVSDSLAKTKKHLTQRIQHLDDKMLEQNELSRGIKDDVNGAQQSLTGIEVNLGGINDLVYGLHDKIQTLEMKQDFANRGVLYLCNVVDGKKVLRPEQLKLEQTKSSGKPRLLPYTDEGLKILQAKLAVTIRKTSSDAVSASQDGISQLAEQPKIQRSASTMC